MLPLLAAIPTIITAVSKVSELFGKGRQTVEQVTGNPSQASTPEELQTEIQKLSPEQQNHWAEIMAKEVDKYVAQNQRLATEIGLIDTNITGKLSAEAASKIAYMRMTTRPWTVRWMVYYVLFPFFLVVIDIAQSLLVTWLPFLKTKLGITPYGTFEHFFGIMKYPENLSATALEKWVSLFTEKGGPTTFAGQLYTESIPWVVSIILGYMGLREVGKWGGYGDKAPEGLAAASASPMTVVGKTLSQGVDLVSQVKRWFK